MPTPVAETAAPQPIPPAPALPEARADVAIDRSPRSATLRLLESTRVSLEVKDADLAGLLLGLGQNSALDILVEPEVTATVTAALRDASLLDLLEQFVVARGFGYSIEGSVLRVHGAELVTETYRLDYPNYQRDGTSAIAIAGFIGATNQVVESGGESDDSSLSTVTTTQSVDLWTEIESAIATQLGTDEGTGRRVSVSRQAGLVTVTAEPLMMRQVGAYLREVARSLDKQVLIDSQIVEVTLDDELSLGVDFEAAPDLGSSTGIFSRLIVPGLREAAVVQSLAPALTQGGIEVGVARDDLGAVLRAIAKRTDVRVVSTPRIATLNNHKALIKVVRNEVFFIAEVETLVTDEVAIQTTEFVPQVVPVGVTLDVTPHVSNANEITLHVRPSVSEIVSIEPQPTSDPSLPQTGSLPVVDLRETDSVVRVAAGTTLVIGGLVREREFEQQRGVPLLGDAPLLGALFRNQQTEKRQTELLIFLTPRILDAPEIRRTTQQSGSDLEAADRRRRERAIRWPQWAAPASRKSIR
jgi:MSHA biogenesis protein MshL